MQPSQTNSNNSTISPYQELAKEWLPILKEIQEGDFYDIQTIFSSTLGADWYYRTIEGQEEKKEIPGLVGAFSVKGKKALKSLEGTLPEKYKILCENILIKAYDKTKASFETYIDFLMTETDCTTFLNESYLKEYQQKLLEMYDFILQTPFTNWIDYPQALFGTLIFAGCSFVQSLDLESPDGVKAFNNYLKLNLHCMTALYEQLTNVDDDWVKKSFEKFIQEYSKHSNKVSKDKTVVDFLAFTGISNKDIKITNRNLELFGNLKVGFLDIFYSTLKLCCIIENKKVARDAFIAGLRSFNRGIDRSWILHEEERSRHFNFVLNTVKSLKDFSLPPKLMKKFYKGITFKYIIPLLAPTLIQRHTNGSTEIKINGMKESFGFKTAMPFYYDIENKCVQTLSASEVEDNLKNLFVKKDSSFYQNKGLDLLEVLKLYRAIIDNYPDPDQLEIEEFADQIVVIIFTGLCMYLQPDSDAELLPCDLNSIMPFVRAIVSFPETFKNKECLDLITYYIYHIYNMNQNAVDTLSSEDKATLAKCLLILQTPEQSVNCTITSTSTKNSKVNFDKQKEYIKIREQELKDEANKKLKEKQEYDKIRRTEMVEKQKFSLVEPVLENTEKFNFKEMEESLKKIEEKEQKKQLKNHEIDPNKVLVEIEDEPKIELKLRYFDKHNFEILCKIFGNKDISCSEIMTFLSYLGIEKKNQNGSHRTFDLNVLKGNYQWNKIGDEYKPFDWEKNELIESALLVIAYHKETDNYLGTSQLKKKLEILGIIPEVSVFLEPI